MTMDLSRERWEAATAAERASIADRLGRQLPAGFAFESVQVCRLGDVENHVARYRRGASRFALIPGGPVTLGFDRPDAWEPTPDERASWDDTVAEYGLAGSIQEHIAATTLRPRRVELPPLLIETTADEMGWEPIDPDDPEVVAIVREHGTRRQVTVTRGAASLRVRRGPDDSVSAERAREATHADLAARLARDGFRFPTSAEWEYACGGGAATLFRWGDHAPCDRYPTDISPAEAAWRLAWVRSRRTLARPPEGFIADWEEHRRPNALGLQIAIDPYKSELVAEPDLTRGGDGGCTICGGAGFLVGWLTLATAYFEDHACRRDPAEPIMPGFIVGRRVLDLGRVGIAGRGPGR